MNQEFYDWIEKATAKIASPEQKKLAHLKLEIKDNKKDIRCDDRISSFLNKFQ